MFFHFSNIIYSNIKMCKATNQEYITSLAQHKCYNKSKGNFSILVSFCSKSQICIRALLWRNRKMRLMGWVILWTFVLAMLLNLKAPAPKKYFLSSSNATHKNSEILKICRTIFLDFQFLDLGKSWVGDGRRWTILLLVILFILFLIYSFKDFREENVIWQFYPSSKL